MIIYNKLLILLVSILLLLGCEQSSDVLGEGYANMYVTSSLKNNKGLKAFYDSEPEKKTELLNAVRDGYAEAKEEGAASEYLRVFWIHQQESLAQKILFTSSEKILRYARSVADWLDMLENKHGVSCYDVGIAGEDLNHFLLAYESQETVAMLTATGDILGGKGYPHVSRVTERQVERWFTEAVNAVSLEVAPKDFTPKFLWNPLSARSPSEKRSACITIEAFLKYMVKKPQRGPILLRKFFSGE